MKNCLPAILVLLLWASAGSAQSLEVKFIADALVVQAEGAYEADPDLATLTFRIFSQEKELKKAYDAATCVTLLVAPALRLSEKDRSSAARFRFNELRCHNGPCVLRANLLCLR